ncbi:MAG: ATP-dependent Clp protease proteolytic subunit, partial [Euryarchaeota archaeon]|nr:ATP-dependent Clp protease proteolytic subunit [Euryarchaeota archaeon]
PLGGMQGQASDVEIQANELVRWKRVLTEIYVRHTGRSYQELEKDMDRDNFMTAPEAVAYGLVDEVIESR